MDWVNAVLQPGTLSPSLRIGLTVLALSLLGFVLDIFYNLLFSPLSKFPGPKLCAISRVPHLLVTIRGKQLPWLVDLHNKYGGVVRVAPDALTFTDERAWGDICGSTKYAKDGMAKDPRLAALIGGDLVTPDPAKPRSQQTHAIMRRAMVPALKGANVKKLEGMIDGHIQEYLAAVGKQVDTPNPVDMRDMNSFFICNLIADLFLGESLELFKKDTFRSWVHSFDRFSKGVTIISVLNRFPMAHQVLLFAVQRWGGKERDSFMQPIFDRFDRRVSLATPRDDMLQMVMDGDDASSGRNGKQNTMPLDLLREFAPILMLGGCEAMPTVLTGFVYFVFRSQNAAVRKRLLAEVRGNFKSEQDITMDRIAKSAKELPYLEACLQESIRCYSPAATGTDRIVPSSGAQIAGQFVPSGTTVMMLHQVTYSVHHNFTRPDEFVPERWLPAEAGRPESFENDKRGSVHPFSVGPQSCFGQELTFYVLRLALCKLLYRYDIQLTKECENWLDGQLTYSTRTKPPLMVTVSLAKSG